jgi:hypothetical protein
MDIQFNEEKSYWEDIYLPNLKYLEVDIGGYEDSKELSSILLRCSPLIDKICLTNLNKY